MRARLIPAWVAALAVLCGCAGPGYYAQAIGGHFSLMRERRDVAELRAAAETPPGLAARLAVAEAILDFAESELGLPSAGNYRTYVETGREAVVWNVVAAPEFSLQPRTWCFPVAGCVAYRGYFAQDDARHAADRLRRRGYDASVTPATAYSTLGWFRDPLLDTMLERSDVQLAATLFHELAHIRLHVRGDTAFNESFATFVEREATRRWLERQRTPADAAAWSDWLSAGDRFFSTLLDTRRRLQALYASDLPPEAMRAAKREAFERLRADYDRTVAESWGGRSHFARFFDPPPNNADLALVASYQGGVCAFERLMAEARDDFHAFLDRAERVAARGAATRATFLRADCGETGGDIAPADHL